MDINSTRVDKGKELNLSPFSFYSSISKFTITVIIPKNTCTVV